MFCMSRSPVAVCVELDPADPAGGGDELGELGDQLLGGGPEDMLEHQIVVARLGGVGDLFLEVMVEDILTRNSGTIVSGVVSSSSELNTHTWQK